MARTKTFENRKPVAFSIEEKYAKLLKKRYANVSEIVNDLISKHLEELGLIDLPLPKKQEKVPELPIDKETIELQEKLADQAEFNRELYNAVYLKCRSLKNDSKLQKRWELFEQAIREPEFEKKLKEEYYAHYTEAKTV